MQTNSKPLRTWRAALALAVTLGSLAAAGFGIAPAAAAAPAARSAADPLGTKVLNCGPNGYRVCNRFGVCHCE